MMSSGYRSKVAGGYYSSPGDVKRPVSIRYNNPGALNTAPWLESWPGYLGSNVTTPGNRTAIFETPEDGIAAWLELMRRYRISSGKPNGYRTIYEIIWHYGGGQQNYKDYAAAVAKQMGVSQNYEIKIDGSDDSKLIAFARAMFRYEAGEALPWSDEQIRFGFGIARAKWQPPVIAPLTSGGILGAAIYWLAHHAGMVPWLVATLALLAPIITLALVWELHHRNHGVTS